MSLRTGNVGLPPSNVLLYSVSPDYTTKMIFIRAVFNNITDFYIDPGFCCANVVRNGKRKVAVSNRRSLLIVKSQFVLL
jgi:hypothetical protein